MNGTTSSSNSVSPVVGDVVVDDQGQEIEVVGDPGADADPGRRMPPVLDVALLELPGRRPQDLRPRLFRGAVDQGHDVLELVPKAVRPARLVERRAGPHPAGQHLVEQPAVEHQVHAGIGRLHLHGVQEVIPSLLHLGQHLPGSTGGGVGGDEAADLFRAFRLAQDEDDFSSPRRGPASMSVITAAARVERRADAAREADPPQSGGCGHGTVAAEEFRAIRGHRPAPTGRRPGRRSARRSCRPRRSGPGRRRVSGSRSQTTCSGAFSRTVPSTHSA